MTPTPFPTTPNLDATVWSCEDTTRICRVAFDQAIILEEGEFLVRFPNTGAQFIARLTGRTRKFFNGLTCPTIERFTIDTVVRESTDGSAFALWGVRGERLPGTWATRSQNIPLGFGLVDVTL